MAYTNRVDVSQGTKHLIHVELVTKYKIKNNLRGESPSGNIKQKPTDHHKTSFYQEVSPLLSHSTMLNDHLSGTKFYL